MFENQQIAVIKEKCRRFMNSSECLKTHRATFWTQKVPKEAERCGLHAEFYKSFFQKHFVVNERSSVKNSFST